MENKIIAVDFDGTLCENKWPEIGEANKEMISYLKDRQANGDKLILWTCRVDDMLKNAIDWSAEQGLIFDAINENLPEIVASFGTDTRKIFANEYIDDRNAWYPSEGFKDGIEHIQEEIVTVLRRILPYSLLESIFDVKPEDVHRKQ